MTIRIVTWNVNGIRNPFKYAPWNDKRTLQSMFEILEGDIVCFQEVKTPKSALTDDLVVIDGWDSFYSFPHSQTGYSGVAVYTRDSKCIPLRVEEGITGILKIPGTQTRYVDTTPDKQIGGYPTDKQLRRAAVDRDVIDSEGRCLILEFPLFVLINVYCPARRNQERTGYRNTFLLALDARIRNLAAAGKNVVLLGDLNITRDQLDTAGIWDHKGTKSVTEALEFDTCHMTMRAPKLLNQLLLNSRQINELGMPFIEDEKKRRPPVLCDTGRELHPTRTGMFTCWDTRKNHRPANYGSRIDYIACSPKIMQLVQEAEIQPQLHGSDHCPVYIVLRDSLADPEDTAEQPSHIFDYLNPPGRFVNGKSMLPEDKDAALLKRFPQSGRRLPQFSNRRHIGNMFRQAAKPQPIPQSVTPLPQTDTGGELPVDLPAVFKADVVQLVESDDDADLSGIEDDDSDDMVDGDEDDDEPDSAKERKEIKKSSTLAFPSIRPSQVVKPLFSTLAAGTDDVSKTGDAPISTLAEQDADPTSSQATGSTTGNDPTMDWPQTPPKQNRVVPVKRQLLRTKSGTSSSGTTSSSSQPAVLPRPTKKAKTTGIQTSMSMFLKAREPATAPAVSPKAREKEAAAASQSSVATSIGESPSTTPKRRSKISPRPSPNTSPMKKTSNGPTNSQQSETEKDTPTDRKSVV